MAPQNLPSSYILTMSEAYLSSISFESIVLHSPPSVTLVLNPPTYLLDLVTIGVRRSTLILHLPTSSLHTSPLPLLPSTCLISIHSTPNPNATQKSLKRSLLLLLLHLLLPHQRQEKLSLTRTRSIPQEATHLHASRAAILITITVTVISTQPLYMTKVRYIHIRLPVLALIIIIIIIIIITIMMKTKRMVSMYQERIG